MREYSCKFIYYIVKEANSFLDWTYGERSNTERKGGGERKLALVTWRQEGWVPSMPFRCYCFIVSL